MQVSGFQRVIHLTLKDSCRWYMFFHFVASRLDSSTSSCWSIHCLLNVSQSRQEYHCSWQWKQCSLSETSSLVFQIHLSLKLTKLFQLYKVRTCTSMPKCKCLSSIFIHLLTHLKTNRQKHWKRYINCARQMKGITVEMMKYTRTQVGMTMIATTVNK